MQSELAKSSSSGTQKLASTALRPALPISPVSSCISLVQRCIGFFVGESYIMRPHKDWPSEFGPSGAEAGKSAEDQRRTCTTKCLECRL